MSGLNENEKQILKFLYENKKIANKQAKEITGLSAPQIRRIFSSLKDKNIIEPQGNGRGRYYVLGKNKM